LIISKAIFPFGENCCKTRPAYCVLVESFDPMTAAIVGRSR